MRGTIPTALAVLAIALSGSAARAGDFVVNSDDDADDGLCNAAHCSLREALNAANASPGADTVRFSIPPGGPQTIKPGFPLPWVSSPVTIDGTFQGGYAGQPLIEISGVAAGTADGLVLGGTPSTVRGLVINGWQGNGLVLHNSAQHRVAGNYIGTDQSGTFAVPSADYGILMVAVQGCTIGGLTAADRNVISGNRTGIAVNSLNPPGNNRIRGNYIGTDWTGTQPLGNQKAGVFINNSPGVTIEAMNVIADNGAGGILIKGAGATGNVVQRNLIGVGSNGVAMGNGGNGVRIEASSNFVGGFNLTGPGNAIANNGGAGVVVVSGSGNTIRRNNLYGNGLLGIDLGADGVTLNDPLDGDSGPNGLQNHPELFSPVAGPTGVSFQWTLESTPGTSFWVDVHYSATCHPSGSGESQWLAMTLSATTDASGATGLLSAMTPFPIPAGYYLTAVATSATGSTSELSKCALIQ